MRGLLVTSEELDRVPRLRPFATRFDGALHTIDVNGPCPYLLPDMRSGTFDTRPFDCSLFPVAVNELARTRDGGVVVHWARGAATECPHPDELARRVRRAVVGGDSAHRDGGEGNL